MWIRPQSALCPRLCLFPFSGSLPSTAELPGVHGEAALGCFDSKSFLFFFDFFSIPSISAVSLSGSASGPALDCCPPWSGAQVTPRRSHLLQVVISANPGHPIFCHFLSSFHTRQMSFPFVDGFRARGQRALQVASQIILFKTILSSIL